MAASAEREFQRLVKVGGGATRQHRGFLHRWSNLAGKIIAGPQGIAEEYLLLGCSALKLP